mmetsp:Transcript_28964/g.97694  ORF Transcript_28964/g.97694 Transcript_28964/m.97694 type:complete len:201 (-) Transcript_28964:819-1421(-)
MRRRPRPYLFQGLQPFPPGSLPPPSSTPPTPPSAPFPPRPPERPLRFGERNRAPFSRALRLRPSLMTTLLERLERQPSSTTPRLRPPPQPLQFAPPQSPASSRRPSLRLSSQTLLWRRRRPIWRVLPPMRKRAPRPTRRRLSMPFSPTSFSNSRRPLRPKFSFPSRRLQRAPRPLPRRFQTPHPKQTPPRMPRRRRGRFV